MNEKKLIKACQKGEKQAFEELICIFYPYVFKFLLKMTGDKLLSEDLTQETFLKMICNIERYNLYGKAGFGTWVITIAKNCYIDYMRRNNKYLESIEVLSLEDSTDIAEKTIRKMQYEEMLRDIESLPPEQGLAIRLKYEEGMTLAEIAELFEVPPKTIKSRIHDGTIKLRRILKSKERTDHYE